MSLFIGYMGYFSQGKSAGACSWPLISISCPGYEWVELYLNFSMCLHNACRDKFPFLFYIYFLFWKFCCYRDNYKQMRADDSELSRNANISEPITIESNYCYMNTSSNGFIRQGTAAIDGEQPLKRPLPIAPSVRFKSVWMKTGNCTICVTSCFPWMFSSMLTDWLKKSVKIIAMQRVDGFGQQSERERETGTIKPCTWSRWCLKIRDCTRIQ